MKIDLKPRRKEVKLGDLLILKNEVVGMVIKEASGYALLNLFSGVIITPFYPKLKSVLTFYEVVEVIPSEDVSITRR